jgi:hypothetical protein
LFLLLFIPQGIIVRFDEKIIIFTAENITNGGSIVMPIA